MNMDNVRIWVNELRTTGKPQTTERLARTLDTNKTGYCCLGIVEVLADSPESDESYDEDGPCFKNDLDKYPDENTFADTNLSTFGRDWLGVKDDDPTLDVPGEYIGRVARIDGGQGIEGAPTCANLNDDWGLSFKEIADMLDYFGLQP